MTASVGSGRSRLEFESPVLPHSQVLLTDDDVLSARRLQAAEYVRVGYVDKDALASDGTLRECADPWVPFSRYLGAFDDSGTLRATCRVITNASPRPLPTLCLQSVDPDLRARLESMPDGRLGEVSALAREQEVGPEYLRSLLRRLWLDALARDVWAYVLCVDGLVLRSLRGMDPNLFRVAGGLSPAPVRPVYPVWVHVADVTDPGIFMRGLPHRRALVLP